MRYFLRNLSLGAAAFVLFVLLAVSLMEYENTLLRDRMLRQADLDAELYVVKMDTFRMVCTDLDIPDEVCIMAWSRGGN